MLLRETLIRDHIGRRSFAAIYFLSFVISKYIGFSNGYALDDYAIISRVGADSLAHQFLSQGRFSFAALQSILAASSLTMLDFHPIALAGFALFSGLMFSSILCISARDNRLIAISVAALLGAHPYITEYVAFRQAALPMALMFLLIWLAFETYLLWQKAYFHGIWRPLIAVALATLAVGFNQLALSFICIGLLFVGLRKVTLSPETFAKRWWTPFVSAASAGLVIGIAYFLIAHLVRLSFGAASDGRAILLQSAEIPARISQLSGLFLKIMVEDEPIVSAVPKIALIVALLILFINSAIRRLPQALYILLFFTVAIALAIAPIAISGVWWPVPRTLIAVPLALAGAILLLQDRNITHLTLPVSGFILFTSLLFAAHSNTILVNQLRINRWDLATAREVFTAAAQQFPEATGEIVLNNPRWAYPAAPGIADGDLNVSALSINWAVKPLFREATGKIVNIRTSTAFTKECSARGVFPKKDSLFEHGRDIIVCM